jgi:acyl carrier protein
MSTVTLGRSSTPEELSSANPMLAFIAERLHVDAASISADSHLWDDLGLDLLDVVELTILLEDEFAPGQITDTGGEMELVGDLIHHIETCRHGAHRP